MQVEGWLEGNCQRCGSTRMIVEVMRRRAILPTCNCKEETLKNMLDSIINVLDRELHQPMYDQAREELKSFVTEFADEDD